MYLDMSPVDFAVHIAAEQVEPFGDTRADMRHAVNTLSVAMSITPVPVDQRKEMLRILTTYCDYDEDGGAVIGEQQIRSIFGG